MNSLDCMLTPLVFVLSSVIYRATSDVAWISLRGFTQRLNGIGI
ncbi:hypothetical protein MHAS44199_09145 [Mycolicibacterium hassiacum DSM 44199]|nr:hypothetical protein [Mycolicibacterium hassiacum DSM 44199]